jgi:YHS domain-containing protein
MEDTSMTEQRIVAPTSDPVCGMTVDVEEARAKGLVTTHQDREYVFCGKGCFLEFRDDPQAFLEPGYKPAM